MSSPVLIFASVWLLVIGYALVFIGYENLILGKSIGFAEAFGIGTLTGSNAKTKA